MNILILIPLLLSATEKDGLLSLHFSDVTIDVELEARQDYYINYKGREYKIMYQPAIYFEGKLISLPVVSLKNQVVFVKQ